MKEMLDENKDPCKNFARFACGGYSKFQPANTVGRTGKSPLVEKPVEQFIIG